MDKPMWNSINSTASLDMESVNRCLNDRSENSALLTDSGHDANSEDPNMEMSESIPLFERTKKKCKTNPNYTVTCTVNIALAVLKDQEENVEYSTTSEKEKSKKEPKREPYSEVLEAPRAESYYCIEYNMLPDDPEPTRVDLVMFGLAAKVYMQYETKVLKPWREGNKVWVSWSQTLKLNVTRELLIKMASHKIMVRVWDSNDKVSFKAKNDRPKAFRLPQDPNQMGATPESETAISGSYILTSVIQYSDREENYTDFTAQNTSGIMKMVCKLRATFERDTLRTKTAKKHQRDPEPTDDTKLSELSCATGRNIMSWLLSCTSMVTVYVCLNSVTIKGGFAKEKKALYQKPIQDNAVILDVSPKKEVASLELSFTSLLAGSTTLTDCLGFCSGGVNEGFWNVTLDQPLLSEQLKAELNPLVITILSASSLPSSPVPFHILKATCLPVYCQYKFHNMPVYRTKGHDHNANIYFKDVNVIFTGLLSPGKLREFLTGPPLEIEVHDRDRKIEKPSKIPAIFGTEPNDDKLGVVDLGITKRTATLQNPYGIAKLDLLELLQGHTYLNQRLPIRNSNIQQSELERTMLQTSSFEIPSDTSMSMGRYLEADSQLKVQVEIAHPLHSGSGNREGDCPFCRIIYVFKYNNTPVLAKLTSEILQINAEAFQLDCYPYETIQRVLSGHKMSAKEREKKNLNVLTGFHLMDKALHLFVLEGLKDQAVKRLWTSMKIKLNGDEEEKVTILYNSSLSFSERLYDTLDVGLSPICLLKPLEYIIKEPLVFIRNVVHHDCLEAMKRISQLCQVKRLIDAVHRNLFPSTDMILSLTKGFGFDLGRGELRLVKETEEAQDIANNNHVTKATNKPLDSFNREYFQRKQHQCNNMKDFIQANIEGIHRASSALQKSAPNMLVGNVADGQAGNSYNIQMMKSKSQGKELLYRELAKDSICIHFTYPGFKSSFESNQHSNQPDDARIEELRKPWRENILHGNKLRPILSRSRLPWNQRNQDFDLYSKPPLLFGPDLPQCIHLAGETQFQSEPVQYNRQLKKKMPYETSQESGRVPGFKCHMKRAGLDKLQDILKDKPMKYSLKRPGMTLKPIPAISVVQQTESTGSAKREANIPFAPGPFQNHSLSWDKNAIPRHSSQYNKFPLRHDWRPHSF
ncbi:uncharacterized protein cfap92 [Xyrauchen texanus]|uniref:uncharacterized protein cfap92 n=1 Tax=Xyrauchen texanus TaxID=154827 RepID=UPI002241B731|nr:uncharacterized protein cfap92 [Xyrauchen texanus]